MNAQRLGLRAVRQSQAAAKSPNAFFSQNLPRLALATNAVTQQSRGAATQKITQDDAHSVLAAQRRQRPVSPHLTTYDYSQIWLGASIWTRITGMTFGGGLYLYTLAYLAAPLAGWHLESASLAAAAGSLPYAVKAGAKFLISWPFLFHAFNGTRHLVWDLGIGYNKATIKKGGWIIWGASLVSALAVSFLY
ncbi:hypothetical protein DL764_009243 [Monosporascus ibericus]|uniref:Uncharacterized protein n=1 Tax=Monosporascus ibericus TaxID=155417 RepID=A0A4Q4SVG5_9PEZI|nr:hypothetical protein DL764_009243 [Monosporascus ibericus]